MNKKLAIKGHPTRGNEVIKLLKMMGGAPQAASGSRESYCYYISEYASTEYKYISWDYIGPEEIDKYEIFTLEEFLEKYPYKVGDKVIDCYGKLLTIKSMEWLDELETMGYTFEESTVVLAAKDLKAINDNKLFGTVSNPVETKSYTVGLKDGKVIDNSVDAAEFMQIGKTVAVCFNTENYEDEVELQLGDYEIAVRDGKTYAVRKKPKYPTNFKGCRAILDNYITSSISGYKASLLTSLQNLLVCRDAYWKIAGEEMGLGKPWKPVYKSLEDNHYFTICTFNSVIDKSATSHRNAILAFPTIEMRDAFYENFKDLIEQCKELL